MMKGLILKLTRLKVRLKRKTLMQRKQKMAQEMLDQDNFLMIQSQSRVEQEEKDMETLLMHLYRKHRRSAKPKFLAG